MALSTVAFLVAFSGVAVSADPMTYPEIASSWDASRIVSGWQAREGQIPYQLSLRLVNQQGTVISCGGSIIHSEWGLTAAHCTALRTSIVVRAGSVNLNRPQIIFETRQYYTHPLFNDVLSFLVQPNDISLVKFGRAISFSDRIQPVRLQRAVDRNRNYEDVRMVASGWGRTWTNGETSDILRWVYLLGDSNMMCSFVFGSIVQASTICVSAYNVSSQSTCQGDNGGPLTVKEDDGRVTLVGVASFVHNIGCHHGIPAGFVRTGHYHAWYTQVTGINFDWEPTPEVEGSGDSGEWRENVGERSENIVGSSDSNSENNETDGKRATAVDEEQGEAVSLESEGFFLHNGKRM